MRLLVHTVLVLAAVGWAVSPAAATVKTSVETKTYEISGRTGTELLSAMDRRGPKHGFLTRAIAQTSYTVNWEIEWAQKNGTCRLKSAVATLSITYTYPKVSGKMSSPLKKKWERFYAGVKAHEETHGTLASQMVKAADKAISGFAMKDDPGCRKAQAAIKRRVDGVYAEYEARQVRFDKTEHARGGAVDGLVRALSR
ncbi:MAG: DUF922 domain-containing protein [Rhizobiaceae bacterium]|nr:DUF922 domain-containing protein [Rhizobiaceae bacterium]